MKGENIMETEKEKQQNDVAILDMGVDTGAEPIRKDQTAEEHPLDSRDSWSEAEFKDQVTVENVQIIMTSKTPGQAERLIFASGRGYHLFYSFSVTSCWNIANNRKLHIGDGAAL